MRLCRSAASYEGRVKDRHNNGIRGNRQLVPLQVADCRRWYSVTPHRGDVVRRGGDHE